MAVSLWDRNEYFEDRLVGTSAFLAPETIVHYERYGQAVYSRASDIWQAGCILYMILAAQYPFGSEATHTGAQLLGNIKARRLQLTGLNLSSDALDLLSKIFVLDPNDRLAGQEILAHPWIVHHSKLPETDFGDSYKSRLKNWSCRKRFRQLLDRNVLGSRARQHALHTVLSLAGHPNPPFLPHHGYMTRSDTSADYLTMDSVQSPQRDEVKPLKRAESLRLFSISSQDIKTLKSAFFDFVSIRIQSPLLDEKKSTIFGSPPPTPLSAPSLSSNNKRFSPSSSANGIQIARFGEDLSVQNTLHHAGIDFDSFTTVVNAAGFTALATREIFDIFDWHRTQSVDYLEFLFTLSSFRRDVDWNDAASVARLYYDIFDMTSVNAISVDMLALVLSKLLTVHDTDEEKNTISLSSLKLADPSFEQTSDSTENEPSVEKDIDSLLSAVPTDSEEDLSAGNIYDVVQSIDTDGDGLITFKDFEAFFHVILRLRSMSSR
jgi:Ca2+-binding EF-hand superfamily protein